MNARKSAITKSAITRTAVLLLGLGAFASAQAAPQNSAELPDSPTVSAADSPTQFAAAQTAPAAQDQASPPSISLHPPSDPPASPPPHQKPVGTAAAEAPFVSGVPASQPAGVAIAPAKQRRVRTLVLRVGAIVGAGVALGSVAALTMATPSKPPGAH